MPATSSSSTKVTRSKSIPTKAKPLKRSGKPWHPPRYQIRAVKYLLDHFSALLLLDPGLGKTSIVLAAAKVLLSEGVLRGLLVVAPLRPSRTTWPKEQKKWEDFKDLDVCVLHKDSYRPGEFEAMCAEKHDIYTINYEGLAKLFKRYKKIGKDGKSQKTYTEELTPAGKALLANVNGLVWDEVTKMKHTNTARFLLVKPWLKKFLIKWGLTGSPASNGMEGLFGQCFSVDEGRTLGPYITHYRARYFVPIDGTGHNWVLGAGCDELIYERLRPLALRMEAEDYIKMPLQLDHQVKFEIEGKARAHYDEMDLHLMTAIEEEVVTAANVGAAMSKCRQIASGALYESPVDLLTGLPKVNRIWHHMHDAKLEALDELIEELHGQQVLVAYEFRHDLERLLKKYPGTPYIGGGTSGKEGERLEEEWNAGNIQMMFLHPQSVGHGLNLQESSACHIIWFTMTYDYELYDQLNRRLRRNGNKAKHLQVYHLIAKDTVEEKVYYTLRRKFKGQKALLDALKSDEIEED